MGVSVGQQSLPELRLTVTVQAAAAGDSGQLDGLVEGVVLPSARCGTKRQPESDKIHIQLSGCRDAEPVECTRRAASTSRGENLDSEANCAGITRQLETNPRAALTCSRSTESCVLLKTPLSLLTFSVVLGLL